MNSTKHPMTLPSLPTNGAATIAEAARPTLSPGTDGNAQNSHSCEGSALKNHTQLEILAILPLKSSHRCKIWAGTLKEPTKSSHRRKIWAGTFKEPTKVRIDAKSGQAPSKSQQKVRIDAKSGQAPSKRQQSLIANIYQKIYNVSRTLQRGAGNDKATVIYRVIIIKRLYPTGRSL